MNDGCVTTEVFDRECAVLEILAYYQSKGQSHIEHDVLVELDDADLERWVGKIRRVKERQSEKEASDGQGTHAV